MFSERIGEQVLEHLIPLRRMLDAGTRVACGSDWGPKNVFEQIHVVVDRNPLACATHAIAATEVLRTMAAGRTVFTAGML